MAPTVGDGLTVDEARATATRLGVWVAMLTAAMAVIAFGIGILTPPHSGPFCTTSCIEYPYAQAAAFFPRDYLWIFPAMLLVSLFVVLCICVDFWVQRARRVFSQIAVAAATAAATLLTLDYFIQLEVMQPSLLRGESNGIALFSQYNPHGIFIAMEDLGYLAMSAAFCFLGLSLGGRSGLERTTRWLLTISSALGFAAFFALSAMYGNNLETRFELVIITITWMTLAASAVLLAVLFRRSLRPAAG